jgi:hypothetical protein
VRINPHEIHINNPEFYDKLYNSDPKLNKDPLMVRELGMTKNIENTVPWSVHRSRRAAFGVFFSRKQIIQLEGLIHKYANKMSDFIRKEKGMSKPAQMKFVISSRHL